MSKNKQYADQYAEYAMDQMRRYGIPASVILAQGILESSNGQSELAKNENNHFGIKATNDWLSKGGKYGIYTDDRPNEKFCSYGNVGESYEHHSRFLKENNRYSECFKLSPADYKGWTEGLEKAGYATGKGYASNLQKIIEVNGLDKYDRMVMEEMRSQGKDFGIHNSATRFTVPSKEEYGFPVSREEFVLVTSPFGLRQDPLDPSKKQMHNGIDIKCNGDRLFPTESNAKVIAVNNNANTNGGKSVTLEYSRPDGTKLQCTYMHLREINVKVNDVLQLSQSIGTSGNTGTRTTGEHLHFSVKCVSNDGSSRFIDPAAYLADISQKAGINVKVLKDGNDLLAQYKQETSSGQNTTPSVTPDDWMKKLLSSEDSGVNIGNNPGDPIVNFAVEMFMGIMSLIALLENKGKEKVMEAATDIAVNKKVNLSSLVPSLKVCQLTMQDNKPLLSVDTGTAQFNHYLTSNEYNHIVQTLRDSSLNPDDKKQRLASVIQGIAATQQASLNFQQNMEAAQSRESTRSMNI